MGTLMAVLEADALKYLVDIIRYENPLHMKTELGVYVAQVRVEAAKAILEHGARCRAAVARERGTDTV
jgi:hypothetical protein